ncbi:PIN domain-containing protein [Beijerinckia sp. L45]|uniref:PIN domain-containing protein n=1 Tax=Beijerinckia sp. L45 TaxID=1641855 RepID=UPI00131B51D4|nr:PIN domain-containing protein [Beijerinckia sp. L45]
MFANRFTAFVDACALTGALKRNLLLTLAEAEFFRLRWSGKVLDETQAAIEKILVGKGAPDAVVRAGRARSSMQDAFEEALVDDFDTFMCLCDGLPDPNDVHVVAAALKTQAAMIVTDNLKHFPESLMSPLNIEARSPDAFIADTIALDPGRAVAAISRMRLRLKRPEKTPDMLLLDMEASGLIETVDALRAHVRSL